MLLKENDLLNELCDKLWLWGRIKRKHLMQTNAPEGFIYWKQDQIIHFKFLKTLEQKCLKLSKTVVTSIFMCGMETAPIRTAESCALSWAHLRVCFPLSAGHLPQTLQKQSC